MQEYWEITFDRGVQTCAAWYTHTAWTLGTVGYAQHLTDVTNLPTLAAARTAAEVTLTQSEEQRRTVLRHLKEIAQGGPHVIKRNLPAGDDLLDAVDGLLAVELEVEEDILRRSRGLVPVWGKNQPQARGHGQPAARADRADDGRGGFHRAL